jgi:type I restriction enzyme M protein
MDLLPPEYVIARYFAAEQAELDRLIEIRDAASLAVAEYIEENAIEGGLLFDAADDEGKLTNAAAKASLKELKATKGDPDEIAALAEAIALYAAEAKAKDAVKDATVALNEKGVAKYKTLAENEVQNLVIDDKWGATLQHQINGEVTALGQILIARLGVLAGRYEATVGDLDKLVIQLSENVARHLADLGIRA